MEVLFGMITGVLYLGGIAGISAAMKKKDPGLAAISTFAMMAGAGLIAWMVVSIL